MAKDLVFLLVVCAFALGGVVGSWQEYDRVRSEGMALVCGEHK